MIESPECHNQMTDAHRPRQVEFLHRERCNLLPNSSNEEHIFEKLLSAVVNGRTYDIIYCKTCKVGFTDPYPSLETVGFLYEDKTNQDDTNFDVIHGSVVDRLKDIVSRIELRRIVPSSKRSLVCRVADFGCGNGRFAMQASEVFPNAKVDAVDIQEYPPSGLDAQRERVQYFSTAVWLNNGFMYDLIVLRHVLEHHHFPVALLDTLRKKLSPWGILYVEVPNLESWYVSKVGLKVNSLGVPYHIYHFTRESLASVIAAAGLTAEIGTNDMPLMGTTLAMMMGKPKTMFFQLIGIALHPLQMLVALIYGKSCLHSLSRRLDGFDGTGSTPDRD